MTKWTIPDDLPAERGPLTEVERLREELHLMMTAGMIEVACRNPSVSEYMTHWEGRTLKAEAKVEVLETTITEALRARDEDIRDILRKGLHGETE